MFEEARLVFEKGLIAQSPLLEKDEFAAAKRALEELKELEDQEKKTRLATNRRAIKRQIEGLKKTAEHILRIEEIFQQGYKLGEPPSSWFLGFVERKDAPLYYARWMGVIVEFRLWRQVLPPEVEEKYFRARKSGLFDWILIASPDANAFFNNEGCDYSKQEAVMYGFVPLNAGKVSPYKSPEVHTCYFSEKPLRHHFLANVIGFEIARWGEALSRPGDEEELSA